MGRVLLSAVMIFPLGALLGTLFPIGMRMAPVSSESFKPWFIGLNGIFGFSVQLLRFIFPFITGYH